VYATSRFQVDVVGWSDAARELSGVRRRVFIDEQGVPEDEEWDGADPDCVHAIARSDDGAAIGTGRLLPDGHIGRMAVLPDWRRLGVGSALLSALLAEARRRGWNCVALNAQLHAIDFYRRFGFVAHGSEFLDAGIPHRAMVLELR
jgi:predicted GNAT family N-acyltransferase